MNYLEDVYYPHVSNNVLQVFDWQSLYQSQHIPIPRFPPIDESQTFIGRLARQLLNITNPTLTLYVDPVKTWYDMKTNEEVLNSSIFGKIVDALEPFGLQGLDRLYCFMIVTELQKFTKASTKLILSDKAAMVQLQSAMKTLHPHSKTVEGPAKFYPPLITKFAKFSALLAPYILRVGQIQILRLAFQYVTEVKYPDLNTFLLIIILGNCEVASSSDSKLRLFKMWNTFNAIRVLRQSSNIALFHRQQISLTLHSLAKFESKQLVTAVETLNNALVANVTSHYTLDHVTPTDSLYEITPYLGACGLTQPLLQVYSTFKVSQKRNK